MTTLYRCAWRVLPTLLLLLWIGQARAQNGTAAAPADAASAGVVTIRLGQSMATLTGPWKFRIGDSPKSLSAGQSPLWAEANFNDADWQPTDLTPAAGSVDPGLGTAGYVRGWTAKGYPGHAGFAWYRIHIHVRGERQPLALLMPIDIDDGYQVYCNGHFLGEFGDFSGNQPRTYYGQPTLFRLPVTTAENASAAGSSSTIKTDAAQDIVLALRFYMKPADLTEDPFPGGLHAPPRLGMASVAAVYYRLQRVILSKTYNFYSIPILVYLLAALAALALYTLDRSQRVFLWLGAAALLNVIYMAFTLSAILTTLVNDRLLILRPILLSVVFWAWLMAWYVWFDLGAVRWLRRTIYGLTALHILLQLAQYGFSGRSMYPFLRGGLLGYATGFTNLLLGLLALAILYYGRRQRKREGGLATLAMICLLFALFPEPLAWLHIPLIWFAFGTQISTRLVLDLAVSLWLLLLLLVRFQRSQRLQLVLQNEMRQAHQVQKTLLPEAPATSPGFHVESMYRPASEVGGDFFQVLPDGQDGLLIVVGDVSGKGLRAAMLVSLIVGTLRTLAEQNLSPGELLQGMNRRLHKRMEGGFATCICARIDREGRMTLANAGHLPPYMDGEELTVPTDLPLGIIPDLDYEERVYALLAGARLVFLTDGIVEARNKKRELYGFDRTRMLIRRSIEEIVRVAQQFGQEDDLTVIDLVWDGPRAQSTELQSSLLSVPANRRFA